MKPAADSTRRNSILICALLVFGTVAVYWQVSGHEFVGYDDPLYVTANPHVQAGLTKTGLAWAFGKIAGEGTYWHPVTWMSHMLDCELFGVKPAPPHLENLFFHIVNALLLLVVLNRMTGVLWKSAVVAALFALHPLQVDTVAWVAERKNLLSTFFMLLGLLAYIRHARLRKLTSYIPVVICFGLGLMCKPMLVTFPLLLLLLDYWPFRRSQDENVSALRRLIFLTVEKLPLFLMSAASGLVTIAAHDKLKLLISTEQFSLPARLANAAVSYVRYLGKTIWPSNLSVFYPYPGGWAGWEVTGAALILVTISILAVRCAKRFPYLLAGWLWFLVALLPVIGIVQAGVQSIADRFMYVPLIGLLVASVWGGASYCRDGADCISHWLQRCLPVSLSRVGCN